MELVIYIETATLQNKFVSVLGDSKKDTFINSLVRVVSDSKMLQNCKPDSIVGARLMSAVINLPINSTLGYAYIVPYKDQAQFQIGYKGLKQLALRTGNYKKLTVNEVLEGELKSYNKFTETYDFSGEAVKNAQDVGTAIIKMEELLIASRKDHLIEPIKTTIERIAKMYLIYKLAVEDYKKKEGKKPTILFDSMPKLRYGLTDASGKRVFYKRD